MSNTVQSALLVACVAVTLLVAWLIPLSLLLFFQVRRAARQMAEVQADLQGLIHDARQLLQNVFLLSQRANQHLEEVDKVLDVVRSWSERTSHPLEEIAHAVQVPLTKLSTGLRRLRQVWQMVGGSIWGDSRSGDHLAAEPETIKSPSKN